MDVNEYNQKVTFIMDYVKQYGEHKIIRENDVYEVIIHDEKEEEYILEYVYGKGGLNAVSVIDQTGCGYRFNNDNIELYFEDFHSAYLLTMLQRSYDLVYREKITNDLFIF